MSIIKQDINGLFRNEMPFFKRFTGELIPSTQFQLERIKDQHIAVIGIDQHIARQLYDICLNAASVQVFPMTQPHWILPHTPKLIQTLIYHPLVVKNRRLFNQRVKSLIALRFLDREVKNPWLKRQLTPNQAITKKDFLKSDTYYQALQLKNCHLNTWPIKYIDADLIHDLQGNRHKVSCIISNLNTET